MLALYTWISTMAYTATHHDEGSTSRCVPLHTATHHDEGSTSRCIPLHILYIKVDLLDDNAT